MAATAQSRRVKKWSDEKGRMIQVGGKQSRVKEPRPNATLRGLRVAPRKVRLVADLIRGKGVADALSILQFAQKGSARPVAKLLNSAIANAQVKGLNVDKLLVAKITVDGGPTIKRFRPRAMGRATPILKRTCHVHIVLDQQ